jgi:hypothetical protein
MATDAFGNTIVGGTAASGKPATPTSAPKPAQPAPVPVPTATLSASPATVDAGRSTTLTWTSTNATSVSIDNGVGAVASAGSTSVTPPATTNYALTAQGPGGLQQVVAAVTVNPPPKPLYVIRILPPDADAANAVFAKAMFDGYPKLVTVYITAAPSGMTTAFAVFSA